MEKLRSIQNENGGGLSVSITGKYTSVRHELAREAGKSTAGEVAKYLSKILKEKISAKEVISAFKILEGREPEWHHAGFYKGNSGRTMGRTFFFDDDDIQNLIDNWQVYKQKNIQIQNENKIKAETKIFGFYYSWTHDYSGKYGRKVNYKVLGIYSGNALVIPKNFTEISEFDFEKIKNLSGTKYYGWTEPKLSNLGLQG
jgi:hypothetical protein